MAQPQPLPLEGFEVAPFTAEGRTLPVYRRGRGPAVVLMHELPGLVPECITLARDIADAGYAVSLPLFFGRPGQFDLVRPLFCLRGTFNLWSAGRSSPILPWLRALARDAAERHGGRVGAIGMCLTGSFALAMMVDPWLQAPVVAQPSLPVVLPLSGKGRREALDIPPDQLARAAQRSEDEGIPVLGFRFASDALCPAERFEALQRLLGERFRACVVPGRGHATLTVHFRTMSSDDQARVRTTLLGFLAERLKVPA